MSRHYKFILIFCLIFIFLNIKPAYASTQIKTVEFYINNSAAQVAANGWWNSTFKIQLPENSISVKNAYIEVLGDRATLSTVKVGMPVFLNSSLILNLTFWPSGEAEPHKVVFNASSSAASLYDIVDNNVYSYGLAVQANSIAINAFAAKAVITYSYDDTSETQLKTVKFLVNSSKYTIAASGKLDNFFNVQLAEDNISIKNAFFEVHGLQDGVAMTLNMRLNDTVLDRGALALPGSGEQLQLETLVNASSSGVSLYSIDSNSSYLYNLSANPVSNEFLDFSSIAVLTYTFNVSSPVQIKTVEFYVNSSNESVTAAATSTTMNSLFNVRLPENSISVRNAWFQLGAESDGDAMLNATVRLNDTILQIGDFNITVGVLGDGFGFISNLNASSDGVSIHDINDNSEKVYNLSVRCNNDGCWSLFAKLFITYSFDPNSDVLLKTVNHFVNTTDTLASGGVMNSIFNINITENPTAQNAFFRVTGHTNATAVTTFNFMLNDSRMQQNGTIVPLEGETYMYTLNVNASDTVKLHDMTNGINTYNLSIKCVGQACDAPGALAYVTYSFVTNTPPQWSNNVSSTPTQYQNILSIFNTTWSDDLDSDGYNVSLFETNISGIPDNYTTFRFSGTNISSFNATYPVGTFYGRFYANDSRNSFNVTSNFTFTIAKNSSVSSNLTIQPSSTVIYGTQTNTTCTETNPEETGNLYRNDSLANIENNTFIILPAGVWNYTCNVTQNANSNYTFTSNSSILTITKAPTNITLWLNGTQNNQSYDQYQVANFTALVNVTGLPINLTSNYTGFNQQNGTTSIINYTTLSTSGNQWNLTAWTDGNANYSTSSKTYFFNVTSTNGPPTWSNNENYTPTEYNPNILSKFNITWDDDNDNNGYNFSRQEMNYSGANNYTTTRPSGTNKSHYEIILPAGAFYWKQYANDSGNLWNYTTQWNFTINRNTSTQLSITFSGNPVTYPTQTTTWCNITVGDQSADLTLLRNGTTAASGSGNQSETILLGAAVYNYSCIYSQSQNYTSYSLLNQYLTVNQNNTYYMNLTINETESNKQYTYPTGSNATSWYSIYNPPTIHMWKNDTQISNETALLGAGLYIYKINTSGNANYSSYSKNYNLTIQQATPTISIAINPGNTTYPTQTNTTCTANVNQVTVNLYRNNSLVNSENNTYTRLPARTWNYTCNNTATQNYTSTSNSSILIISQNTSTSNYINLTINTTESNKNYVYPSGSNATTWHSLTALTSSATMYENTTSISNKTAQLGAGLYIYWWNITGDENYSSSYKQFNLSIDEGTPKVNLTVSPASPIEYETQTNATCWGQVGLTFNLYRNGILANSENKTLITLGIGSYDYVCNTTGNVNYSSASNSTSGYTVNTKTINIYLALNGTQGDKSYIYPEAVNATGWKDSTLNSEGTLNLYRNGSSQSNPDLIRLGNSTYNYSLTLSATNYTANPIINRYARVNKGNASVFISISPGNTTYPTQTTSTCTRTGGENEITLNLYRNDSLANSENNSLITLGANTYLYTCNYTATQNYSLNSTSSILIISKANNTVNLFLNGTLNSNKDYIYPEAVNATGNSSTSQSDITVKLYRNGTLRDSGTPKAEEDILLGNSTYEYKVNASAGQNYSVNDTGLTFYAFVNKGYVESQLFINGSRASRSISQYRVLNFTVKTNVSGRSVELWTNYSDGVWKKWYGPLTEPLFNYTNMTVDGIFNFTANFSGDANYTTDLETWDVTVTEVDTTPPQWSNNNTSPLSPATYSPSSNYQFNITWTDNFGVSDVIFEWNGVTNYTFLDTQISNYSNVYVRNMNDLAAGSYTYRWFAVDGGDNWNQTQTNNYQINKAGISGNLHIAVNGSETDQEKTYPNATNATGFVDLANNQDLVFNLYRNNSLITTGDPASDLILLGGGNYTYIYNTSGGVNYSSGSITRLLNITPSTTNYVDLYLNGNKNQNITIVYGTQSNATAVSASPNSGTVSLYRNSSLANSDNNTLITLGVGTHTYKVNISGNQNYSSNSSGATFYLFINKASTSISLYLNDSLWSSQANSIYPNASKVNATINVSALQSSVVLRRNGTPVSNPEEILLAANVYNYSGEFAGNDNYSSSSVQRILNISRGAVDIKLFLDGVESSRSYEQYSIANFTAQSNVSVPITLQSNYSGFNSIDNNTVIYNQTSLLTVSNFNNLTTNFSGNENYTPASKNYFFNVTPATSRLIMSLVEPTEGSTKLVKEGGSFLMNATITCRIADCGLVNATARYNLAVINDTGTLFTGDTVVQNCTLNVDQSCNVAWNVSTTTLGSWNIDVNASNSLSNNTADAILSVYRVITEVVTVTREIFGYLPTPLLDLEITNLTPVVVAGDNLYYTINLTNIGYNQSSFDAIIHKKVLDNNTKLLEDAVTKAMTTNLLLTDSMKIPRDFKPGRYFFELYVEYVGKNATAIVTFEVIKAPSLEIDFASMLLLLVVIILLIITVRYHKPAKELLYKYKVSNKPKEVLYKILKKLKEVPRLVKIPKPVKAPEVVEIPEVEIQPVEKELGELFVMQNKKDIEREFIRRLKRKIKGEGGYERGVS